MAAGTRSSSSTILCIPDADAVLHLVVAQAGTRPVVVIADEIGATNAAAVLRAGAADFALRSEPDAIIAALERCLNEGHRSRREAIEAATVMAVQAAEEHFGDVFSEAPIGMAIISMPGTLVRVNRTMCEISGYDEADLVGMDFQTLVHPEDLMLDHQDILDLLAGQISSYRVREALLPSQRGDALGQPVGLRFARC